MIDREVAHQRTPWSGWPYWGLLVTGLGLLIIVGLWSANKISMSSPSLLCPLGLIGNVIAVGLFVAVLKELLTLNKVERELVAFRADRESDWPQRMLDNCFASLPLRRSLPMSLECLEEERRTLYQEVIYRWLIQYALPLIALPLFGLVVSFDSLRVEAPLPSYRWLFAPFLLATIETVFIGSLAVWALCRWGRWLTDWQQAASRRETEVFEARERRLQEDQPVRPVDIKTPSLVSLDNRPAAMSSSPQIQEAIIKPDEMTPLLRKPAATSKTVADGPSEGESRANREAGQTDDMPPSSLDQLPPELRWDNKTSGE